MPADSIMVVSAHSDDQILGPGGTIAKYARGGSKIFTVIFSYGEGSHPWLNKSVTAEMRSKEADEADSIIGGQGIKFLGLEEGKFLEEARKPGTRKKLVEIIQKRKPAKIFTHSQDDPHQDHRAVNKIVLETVDSLRINSDILCFDIWNPFTVRGRSSPKLYVDITDTFDVKIKALKSFKSQWIALGALRWSVYFRALLNGLHVGSKYAERFEKIR